MKFKVTTLLENPWLSLRQLEVPEWRVKYVYAHEMRCRGKIVAVLPFRRTLDRCLEYLLRREITPCWSLSPALSAITGGVEEEETPARCARRELYEETGYRVNHADEMFSLGTCYGTKSVDTTYYLYAVDLTHQVPTGDAGGDGSYLEKHAETQWTITPCTSRDPIVSTATLRLRTLHGIQ